MNARHFIELLDHPEQVSATQTDHLLEIIKEYPYFQVAHALHLKGLKNQESFEYNKALKRTAAHTTDRSVLFDFITSERFLQNDVSKKIKEEENKLKEISITNPIDVSVLLDEEEQEKASKILDPDLFLVKENSLLTPQSPEEILSIGKPLAFDKSEAHSFNEWLHIAKFQPIDRTEETKPKAKKKIRNPEDTTERKKVDSSKRTSEVRERKQQIIDSFIETNPKIQLKSPYKSDGKLIHKELPISSETLMTETLARVYVEQKNYKKAKQAFRILSLKYPEKSGFFADQIRAIEQLEEH